MIAHAALDGYPAGEQCKLDAHALLTARRAIYVRRAQRALLCRLLDMGTATADDVRQAVELPPDIDPRCLGSVPGPLVRAGIIRRVSWTPSCRAVRHACHTSVWALVDADAARQWLTDYPELPDLDPCEGEGRQLSFWD
jgi:hypothetical protein